MNNYLSGNTIRLFCEFKDLDGNFIDPQLVKVRTYDREYKLLQEITTGIENDSEGKYHYDLTLPAFENRIVIYEWYGELLGKPVLIRKKLPLSFSV